MEDRSASYSFHVSHDMVSHVYNIQSHLKSRLHLATALPLVRSSSSSSIPVINQHQRVAKFQCKSLRVISQNLRNHPAIPAKQKEVDPPAAGGGSSSRVPPHLAGPERSGSAAPDETGRGPAATCARSQPSVARAISARFLFPQIRRAPLQRGPARHMAPAHPAWSDSRVGPVAALAHGRLALCIWGWD